MSKYLRLGQVAQALGVSVETLRAWELRGTVVFDRWKGQRALRADRLAALVDSLGRSRRSEANQVLATVVSIEVHGLLAHVELVHVDLRFSAILDADDLEALHLEVGGQAVASINPLDLALRPAPAIGRQVRSGDRNRGLLDPEPDLGRLDQDDDLRAHLEPKVLDSLPGDR